MIVKNPSKIKITNFYFLTCMVFIFIFVNTFSQYYHDKNPKSYLYYLIKVFIVDKILCRVTLCLCTSSTKQGRISTQKSGPSFLCLFHENAQPCPYYHMMKMMMGDFLEGVLVPTYNQGFLLSFREQGIGKSALV